MVESTATVPSVPGDEEGSVQEAVLDTSFSSSVASVASFISTASTHRRPVHYCGTPVLDCDDVKEGCYVEAQNGLQTDVVLVTKLYRTESGQGMVGGKYYKCKGQIKALPNIISFSDSGNYWEYPLSDVKTILVAPKWHVISGKRGFWAFPEISSTQHME